MFDRNNELNILIKSMILIVIMLFCMLKNDYNSHAESVWQVTTTDYENVDLDIGNYLGGYAGYNNYKYGLFVKLKVSDGRILTYDINIKSGECNGTYKELNNLDLDSLIPEEDLFSVHSSSEKIYSLFCKHLARETGYTESKINELINSGDYVLSECFAYVNLNIKLNRSDSYLASVKDRMKETNIGKDGWINLGFEDGIETDATKFVSKYSEVKLYDYRGYPNVGSKNISTWVSKVRKYNIDFNSKVEFYDQTYDNKNYRLSKIVSSTIKNPISLELIPTPNCSGEFLFRGWFTEKDGKGIQVLNENSLPTEHVNENGVVCKNNQIYSINNLKLYAYYYCKVTPYIMHEDGTETRLQVSNSNFDFLVGYGDKFSQAYDPVFSPLNSITVGGHKYNIWYNEDGVAIYPATYEVTMSQKLYLKDKEENLVNISYMVQDDNGVYQLYEKKAQPLFTTLSLNNVPKLPEKNGKNAIGWMSEPNGKGTTINFSLSLTGDIIYYAYYEESKIVNYKEPYVTYTIEDDSQWHNKDFKVTAKIVIPEEFYMPGILINSLTNEKKNTKVLLDKVKDISLSCEGATITNKTENQIEFTINKESLNVNNSWIAKINYKVCSSGKTIDVDINTLDANWKIENIQNFAKEFSDTTKVLRLDETLPTYSYNATNDLNNDQKFVISVSDSLSGIKKAYVKIDDKEEIDITESLKFERIFNDSTSHTVTIYAIDNAGNELIAREENKVDDMAPLIMYGFSSKMVTENKNSSKNRFETTNDTSKFYLLVSDIFPNKYSSGIKDARYLITDRAGICDGTDIKEKGTKVNSFERYITIDISDEMLKKAKDIYLVVYAVDNAGNESYTIKKNMAYPNEFMQKNISIDGKSVNSFVGPKERDASNIYLREIPTAMIYINSSNKEITNPFVVTSALDLRWKGYENISLNEFPIYRNKINDMIGLGYRVNFKYDLIGYGTDVGDNVTVDVKLYGKVGNDLKQLYVFEKDNVGKVSKASLTSTYYKMKFVKEIGNEFDGVQENISTRNGKFKTVNSDNAILYFNYLIPANAIFRYNNGTTEVDYTGTEVLVTFDVAAKKYTDYNNNSAYNILKDRYINVNNTTNINSTYGMRKHESSIAGMQVFWYDTVNTALKDVSGSKQ